MMNEKDIITLLKSHHKNQKMLGVLRDCSSNNSDSVLMQNEYYVLLTKRSALVDHWLDYVPEDEARILHLHLVEGVSWRKIAEVFDREKTDDIAFDDRTFQRMQARAIRKIFLFMREMISDDMDYLLDKRKENCT